jgi:hypothetical protein
MTASNRSHSIVLAVFLAGAVCMASDASAQRATGGGGRAPAASGGATGGPTGGATGGGIGTANGAQAVGSNQASAAVTGEVGRSSDRMLNDVGGNGAGGLGGRGAGGMGGLGGLGGLGGMGGLNPFGANPFGMGNSASSKPAVRTRLRSGVELPTGEPVLQATGGFRVQNQAAVVPMRRVVDGYSLSIVDGVATVTGVAKTPKDRRMAELMLKLEPGVREIDNQIVVAQ